MLLCYLFFLTLRLCCQTENILYKKLPNILILFMDWNILHLCMISSSPASFQLQDKSSLWKKSTFSAPERVSFSLPMRGRSLAGISVPNINEREEVCMTYKHGFFSNICSLLLFFFCTSQFARVIDCHLFPFFNVNYKLLWKKLTASLAH